MYFNFFDPSRRLGGFLRIGNRPNERTAETTVCLYQPDGRVVFNFKRPEIADNTRFEAGGMRFEVEAPFERLRIEYAGKACRLADPLAMRDPRAAFQEQPLRPRGGSARDPRRGSDVRRRARTHRAGRSRAGVRARALRAAPPCERPHRDRRRRQRLRRARAARPFLGPAQLAGAALLPLAHGQLRRGFRLHGELDRRARTGARSARASCTAGGSS